MAKEKREDKSKENRDAFEWAAKAIRLRDGGMMSREPTSKAQLLKKIHELERQLEETQETLRAIREGEVDAIFVQGPEGDQIFTLKGENQFMLRE